MFDSVSRDESRENVMFTSTVGPPVCEYDVKQKQNLENSKYIEMYIHTRWVQKFIYAYTPTSMQVCIHTQARTGTVTINSHDQFIHAIPEFHRAVYTVNVALIIICHHMTTAL